MQLILSSKESTDMAHSDSSNSTTVKVKQERLDEHEINQLALEMVEKNRQKMLTQAAQIRQQNQVSQQALQRAGGQQMITFYFSRDKLKENCSEDSLLPKKVEEKRKGTVDEESIKGRFGWTTIHNVHIPYLFRHEEKYCAVRLVENKLLNKYLCYLPPEITTCIHVRSYFITEVEAKLLNEINGKHCEFQFGKEPFTTKDLVVRVSDAKCFYRFLDTCYIKLVQKSAEQSEYCGFVRINGESVVPYTVKGGAKYVPLFYFEGETDTLKLKAEKIEGWELAYLKFCCKVQGIRNELFASDTCSVVSLEDVKQYFPKDTQFEDWWPQKTAEPMRIVNQGTKLGGNWTQRPPGPANTSPSQNAAVPPSNPLPSVVPPSKPPPPPPPAAVAAPAIHNSAGTTNAVHKTNTSLPSSISDLSSLTNNMNNLGSLNTFYSPWAAAASLMNGQAVQAQAQAQALAAAYANYPAILTNLNPDHLRRLSSSLTSSPTALMQTITASSQNTLRPPPLVRSTNSGAATSQTYTSSTSRINNSRIDALRQLGYISDQSSSNPLDALFGNMRHQSSNSSQQVHNSSHNSKSQAPKAPPPLIPVSNGMRTDNLSSHKGVGRNGIDKQKLIDVPAFRPDPSRTEPPYKVRKIFVDGKAVFCINHSAYSFNEQNMVAVQDIIREFFPAASLSECTEVFITVLSVSVYKANWHQVFALMEAWGSDATPDVVPLIKAPDLMTYLSQIKYIFQRHQTLSHQAKRIRT